MNYLYDLDYNLEDVSFTRDLYERSSKSFQYGDYHVEFICNGVYAEDLRFSKYLEKSLRVLEWDKTYAVFPIAIPRSDSDRKEMFTITRQILMTKNVNMDELANTIFTELQILIDHYNQTYPGFSLKDCDLYFKIRDLSLSKEIHDKLAKIEAKSKEKSLENHLESKEITKVKNTIHGLHNSQLVNGKIIPLNCDLNIDGTKMFNPLYLKRYKVNSDEELYLMKNNYFIKIKKQIKNNIVIQKGTIYLPEYTTNYAVYSTYIDYYTLQHKNIITRKVKNLLLFIVDNKLQYLNKDIPVKYIPRMKPVLNNKIKIVTFDIETFKHSLTEN
jgi:hypothetical protein